MKVMTGLVIYVALAAPDVASACRRSPDPAALMSRRYTTVAVVRIGDLIPTSPSNPEHEWRAMATRVSVVEGAEPALNLLLGHAEIPNCREHRPAPRTGSTGLRTSTVSAAPIVSYTMRGHSISPAGSIRDLAAPRRDEGPSMIMYASTIAALTMQLGPPPP